MGSDAARKVDQESPSRLLRQISVRKKIGEILVEEGTITEEELKTGLKKSAEQKLRLGEYLLDNGIISDKDLAQALAKQYHLEFLDLSTVTPSQEALDQLPENIVKKNTVLPVAIKNGTLLIATYDPMSILNTDTVKKHIKVKFDVKVAARHHLVRAINHAYSDSVERIAKHLAEKDSSIEVKKEAASFEHFINKILENAIENQASDIHIEPSEKEVRVRQRIDGVLHQINRFSLKLFPAMISRLKVLANLDIAEKRVAQDGRFQYLLGQRQIDVRISTLPTIRGEKAVLRILDKSRLNLSIEEVGMKPEMSKQVKSLLRKPYGLILVTGPTGSGKTTTVYSMLNDINDTEKNIITVEDPVEYQFDLINQVQVNIKSGIEFNNVLRNILRQDPDVIMIGEIRDQETADTAIRAALTGHLVISTLHTNDAISTIGRLADMGVEPFLLSSALLGILSQRLVRVLCKNCKEEMPNESPEFKLLGRLWKDSSKDNQVYRPKGCEQCMNSGYQGRVPLFELLATNKELENAIAKEKTEAEIRKILEQTSFTTLREDGIHKVSTGMTSISEVLKATL